MSIEQTPAEDGVNLDDFSAELFGQSKAPPEPASSEENDEDTDDPEIDASNDEDTQSEEVDTLDTEDDPVEDEVDEKPAEKPKKSRVQERIDEVVAKQRAAEREAAELRRELEALKQPKKEEPKPVTPAPVTNEAGGPAPTDTNEDGTDKYPLGEFDPQYIRDLMRHTLVEERKAQEAEAQKTEAQRAKEAEAAALETEWSAKLETSQVKYPDFGEKVSALEPVFEGMDEAYGTYLAQTVMGMEYGADVLYYLANNPEEAAEFKTMGATKATIALGRLEAKFAVADAEKTVARPRVSNAPPPPPTNKGAAQAAADVPDDTDDLDAFAAKMFSKRKT